MYFNALQDTSRRVQIAYKTHDADNTHKTPDGHFKPLKRGYGAIPTAQRNRTVPCHEESKHNNERGQCAHSIGIGKNNEQHRPGTVPSDEHRYSRRSLHYHSIVKSNKDRKAYCIRKWIPQTVNTTKYSKVMKGTVFQAYFVHMIIWAITFLCTS